MIKLNVVSEVDLTTSIRINKNGQSYEMLFFNKDGDMIDHCTETDPKRLGAFFLNWNWPKATISDDNDPDELAKFYLVCT